LQAALGLSCFAVGAVGALVPGLPTTVFLLVGSYFLARSCPAIERTLRESALLRPYARYLDPSAGIPRRVRIRALLGMWGSVAASLALLAWRELASPALAGVVLAAGAVGTVAIVRFRRPRPS
jgi:uncharacterized membrane protein YbaN (DUF454 family)